MTAPRILIDAYLDDELTPDMAIELRSWLEADRDNVRTFIRETHAHKMLRDIVMSHAIEGSLVKGNESTETERGRLLAPRQPHGDWSSAVRRYALVAGLAAAVAIIVGVAFLGHPPSTAPAKPIARLTGLVGEVYVIKDGARTRAEPGHALYAGQGIHTVGGGSRAVLEYPDSTRLELGPDTIVSQLTGGEGKPGSAKKVVFRQCVLSAYVPPQSDENPMVLATPDAEVLVANTEMTLLSEPSSLRPADARGTDSVAQRVESRSIVGVGKGSVRMTSKGSNQAIDVSQGNYTLVTGTEEIAAQPMSAPINAVQTTLLGHTKAVWYVAYAPDGSLMATTGEDHSIKLWSLTSAAAPITLEKCNDDWYFVVAFSPDGKWLAGGKGDQGNLGRPAEIKVWDLATRQVHAVFSAPQKSVYCLAFSPDSRTLAAACRTGDVELWDPVTGQKKATLPGTRRVQCLAFSPDGRTLALGGRDKTVRLWDLEAGQERAKLEGHRNEVWSVAFSRDGQQLASGSADKTLKIWDVAGAREVTTLEGHADQIWSIAFSPDGKSLASGSWDKTVKVWNTATWQEQATLKAHTHKVWCIAFAPDGKTLASASEDSTVKIWEAAADQ